MIYKKDLKMNIVNAISDVLIFSQPDYLSKLFLSMIKLPCKYPSSTRLTFIILNKTVIFKRYRISVIRK